MLKKIIIEGFRIYGENIEQKKVEINFKDGKVIITGNNGIGKTSLINLIVGIFQNNNSWYNHVRYKKIIFTFDDESDEIIIKGKNLIKSISDLSEKDLIRFQFEIENIKKIYSSLKSRIFIFKESYRKKIEDKLLKKNSKFDDFFALLNKMVENSESSLRGDVRIDLVNSVINCNQCLVVDFINHLMHSMKSEINKINSRLLSEELGIQDKIDKISIKMHDKFEYFSIYRRAKEFLTKDSKHNPDNSVPISFEMLKSNFKDSIENFQEKIKSKILSFKNSFFNIVADNKWKIDRKEEVLERLELISKISYDKDISNLVNNLKNDSKYSEKIKGFVSNISLDDVDDIWSFFERTNNFLNKINQIFSNKKIILKNNSLYIKKQEREISMDNENLLSAGEKQMFMFLYKFYLSQSQLVIIDEPEISLSIRWQQVLRETMDEYSKGKNVLFITHSPYLISKSDVEGKRIIFLDEK